MKRRILFVAAAIFLAANFVLAQTAIWETSYDNVGDFDRAYSICKSHDQNGGYVLAGFSNNANGDNDLWIVKFDASGNYLADYVYDGGGSEVADDIIAASSGEGYIVTGYTDAYSTHVSDAFVLKLNSDLTLNTDFGIQTYGGADHDAGQGIAETDNEYVIVGRTLNEDGVGELLMLSVDKTDGSNPVDLAAAYYNTGGAGMNAIDIEILEDGFALLGYDGTVAKLDFNGEVIWEEKHELLSYTQAYDFDPTLDGGFIVTGTTSGAMGGSADYYLMKFAADGSFEWSETYGGESVDLGFAVEQTNDGGYLVSGSLWSFGNYGDDEIGILKTDALGNTEWFYIHEDEGIEWGYTLMLLENGNFVIAGSNSTLTNFDADFYLLEFTPPTGGFTTLPNPACSGEGITLTTAFPDFTGATSYYWTVENSSALVIYEGTEVQPFLYGLSAGNYNVSLGVNGNDPETGQFEVKDVIADFDANKDFVFAGGEVTFTDKSFCTPDEWSWDFGDGIGTSTFQNPVYTYNNPGLYQVELIASNSDGSDIATKNIKVFCNASGIPGTAWISSFGFEGSMTTSGDNGYEDFTSKVFNLVPGEEYDIILTPGQQPGKPLRLDWRIWIDYNMNGIFDDDVIVFDNKKGEVNGTIQVPTDAVAGNSLMRVVIYYDYENNGACESGFVGEVEDYSIQIAGAAVQTLPPVAEFEATPTLVSSERTVYFTDLTYNDPTSWNWEIVPQGGGASIPLTGQNPSHTFDDNDQGIYDVTLIAANAIGSDTETKIGYIEVLDNSGGGSTAGDYCPPQNIDNSTANFCESVTIGTTTYNTGESEPGYVYYSENSFGLIPGGTYAVTLVPHWTRTRYFWRIWVDLNDDGDFEDTGELVFEANNQKKAVEGSLTIPETAQYDLTRLRVSMKKESAQTGPCDDNFAGEVEDYVVDPNKSLRISNVIKSIEVTLYPNPVKDDRLTLELRNITSTASIEVFNKYGAVVDRMETASSKINLNVSGYAAGIYYVKVMHAGEIKVMKFVK